MRFVDSNVFIYAYLKPRRSLSEAESRLKESAKKIVARINSGERVVTSVIHVAEIANILEDNLPVRDCLLVERALIMNECINIAQVSREDCIEALDEAEGTGAGLNDCVAAVVMNRNGLTEVYSFDEDFDAFKGVKRLTG